MALRPDMTHWYSVPRLLSIGVRVVVSTVFGQFADRRDSLAAERPLDPAALDPTFKYTALDGEDFWLDYVADTGDGWNSTYAVARLLAEPALQPERCEESLSRARVLIMGGDEVYPTSSREDYEAKLVAPYVQASRRDDWPADFSPDLYAIPGNHDWYDGLSAFLNLFCWRQLKTAWSDPRDGHHIGGWRTRQTRSYFALELPHDWWLWGTHIQLTNYIDQQQINYFEHAARHWMPANARLILCAGVPDWVYADPANPNATFSHFSFFEGLLYRVGRGQRLCVIVTGDSHHSSGCMENDRHYITAEAAGRFCTRLTNFPCRRRSCGIGRGPTRRWAPPPAPVHPGNGVIERRK